MATSSTVKLFAPVGVGGVIQAVNGTYIVASDGTVNVNAADALTAAVAKELNITPSPSVALGTNNWLRASRSIGVSPR